MIVFYIVLTLINIGMAVLIKSYLKEVEILHAEYKHPMYEATIKQQMWQQPWMGQQQFSHKTQGEAANAPMREVPHKETSGQVQHGVGMSRVHPAPARPSEGEEEASH